MGTQSQLCVGAIQKRNKHICNDDGDEGMSRILIVPIMILLQLTQGRRTEAV